MRQYFHKEKYICQNDRNKQCVLITKNVKITKIALYFLKTALSQSALRNVFMYIINTLRNTAFFSNHVFESVLEDSKKSGLKKDYVDRMVLTLDFRPALFGVHEILRGLQVLTDMSPIFLRGIGRNSYDKF